MAWLAMMNFQEPWVDHLTSSAEPIVFSTILFTLGWSTERNHLQCHG